MTDMRVVDLIGPICVTQEDGERLFHLTREALSRGETVCLDFSGVTVLVMPFLTDAIGNLYAFFDKDDLDRRLHWKGLEPNGDEIIRLVQRKAILFFSASESVRQELLAITGGIPLE